MCFEQTWTIYAGDTDYSGRIYTPVAIDYALRTLQEFRASIGFPNKRFEREGYIPPVRNIDLNYLSAIQVDDQLTISIEPSIGETSMTYEVTGTVGETNVLEGTITAVYVDTEREKPISVPKDIRDAIVSSRADSEG